MNMVTVQLAWELRSTDIKVNSANPGFTKTDLNNNQGDVHPVIRPKWNTNSDEERVNRNGKEEVQRRADTRSGEAAGSKP